MGPAWPGPAVQRRPTRRRPRPVRGRLPAARHPGGGDCGRPFRLHLRHQPRSDPGLSRPVPARAAPRIHKHRARPTAHRGPDRDAATPALRPHPQPPDPREKREDRADLDLRFRDLLEHDFATAHNVNHYAQRLGYSQRTLNRATQAAAGEFSQTDDQPPDRARGPPPTRPHRPTGHDDRSRARIRRPVQLRCVLRPADRRDTNPLPATNWG